MQDDGDTQKLAHLRDLVEQAKECATQARKGIEHISATATQAHQQATSARERARTAKRRELAAHARTIQLHEQAAELQARLDHPVRVATARQHAAHARELQEQALAEQTAQEGWPA
jgi:hypothetical protein